MKREYERWFSPRLGREMEMLVFGHGGLPALVFPSSCGRFFEFEDRGMVAAVADRIEGGRLQLFCVDSVEEESWYNRRVPPRWRIARHMQYEAYCMEEVLPLIGQRNATRSGGGPMAALGCSFGGYHAVNIALRHPEVFSSFLSMSGAFDMTSFLSGYFDEDCYFHLPFAYMANVGEGWHMDRYRNGVYVLATGEHDQCWNQNERFGALLRGKGIPVRLDVWGDGTGHDWPWWQRMMQTYL